MKAVTIDGYKDIEEEESAIVCALLNQPVSVGIDGGAYDFQLYSGVSLLITISHAELHLTTLLIML